MKALAQSSSGCQRGGTLRALYTRTERRVSLLAGNPVPCGASAQSGVRRIVDHHIFGRSRDSLTVPACLNCHEDCRTKAWQTQTWPMTHEKGPTQVC